MDCLGEICLAIQKEVSGMVLKDGFMLKKVPRKYCWVGKSNETFFGFFIKKGMANGDIGFHVCKPDVHCTYMRESGELRVEYISAMKFNAKETVVYVTLDRNQVMTSLLTSIWNINLNGETLVDAGNECKHFLLCHLDGQLDSVVNMRSLLHLFFIKRLYRHAERREPYLICNIINNEESSSMLYAISDKEITDIERELSIRIFNSNPDLKANIDNPYAIISHLKESYKDFCYQENGSLAMNGKGLLHHLKLKKEIYSKDISLIDVIDGEGNPASLVKEASVIANIIGEGTVKINHVVPFRRLHRIQKLSLLLQAKYSSSLQSFFTFEQKPEVKMDSYVEARRDELWESYKIKYGSKVVGSTWEETIQKVAIASLKLDLFSLSLNNSLDITKLDVSNISSRKSLFILYNYARLCKIKEHFEEKVQLGSYKALPDICNIPFSVLTEEMEWKLVVRYILFFPVVFHNLLSSLFNDDAGCIQLPVKQVCQFLCDLSHDFSSYYHHTKVLLDPQPHLLNLIFARLYLVLALREVMIICFKLIGINPPEQM